MSSDTLRTWFICHLLTSDANAVCQPPTPPPHFEEP